MINRIDFPITMSGETGTMTIPVFDGSSEYSQKITAAEADVRRLCPPVLLMIFPEDNLESGVGETPEFMAALDAWISFSAVVPGALRIAVCPRNGDVFSGFGLAQHVVIGDRSGAICSKRLKYEGMGDLLARRSDTALPDRNLSFESLRDKGFVDYLFGEDDREEVLAAVVKSAQRRRAGLGGINRAIAVLRPVKHRHFAVNEVSAAA